MDAGGWLTSGDAFTTSFTTYSPSGSFGCSRFHVINNTNIGFFGLNPQFLDLEFSDHSQNNFARTSTKPDSPESPI